MHDDAPVADEGGIAGGEASEGIGEAGADVSSREGLADLAAEVTDLAARGVLGVAFLAGVVGVEVAAGGGAGAGGVDGVLVDVEGWGGLVGGFGTRGG